MRRGSAAAMTDLQPACAAVTDYCFYAAVFDALKKLGAHSHGDFIFFITEAVVSGNAAAAGVGFFDGQTGNLPQQRQGWQADALHPQMARNMVHKMFRYLREVSFQLTFCSSLRQKFNLPQAATPAMPWQAPTA